MTRAPRKVRLDFVATVHRAPLAGAALLLAGLAAAAGLAVAFEGAIVERGRLDAALGALAPPRRVAQTPESLKRTAEASAVQRELGTPWTRLLAELEAASQDSSGSVSLLRVEPDPGKQRVRITAEVRALPDALAFLLRLQQSAVLRYPMLESHERRKQDPEHPLRIELSAEWHT